ncbi:hypothetical protein EV359DRAFT_76796 [Lentinula novae-zelandiae]|nr:hypothetical protein EV359DRAFT_76796 [Lentinula novae-zelandiae]
MISTGIALNGMASPFQAAALHCPQVFDRSLMRPSVFPPNYLESFSSETQALPVPLLPLGHSSKFTTISISIPNASRSESDEITMELVADELPPPQLLDEVMDDLENIMDVDEVYGGTERSGAAGAGVEEMFVTLAGDIVGLDDSDRMVVDAGHASPFDIFVEYFSSVMCPGSWMNMDSLGCRFQ